MVMYPQQHLEALEVPFAVLAVDTTGHLPINSNGNRWQLKAICLSTSYICAVPVKAKSVGNIVQAYLSNILTQNYGSVAIFSNNGTVK